MPEPGPSPAPPRTTLRGFLLVTLTCLGAYTVNFRELGLTDTLPATLLPASLLRDGDLALDEFAPLLEERSPDGAVTLSRQVEWTRALRPVRGHLRSSYPVGAAVLAAPFYAAPVALGWLETYADYRAAGKAAASALTALSAGVLYLALLRLASSRAALLLALFYGLGTPAWVIASQAMWQHGPAMLCLAVAVLAALRLRERGLLGDAALLGLAASAAVAVRPQTAIAALALGAHALLHHPRRAPALLAPVLAVGGLQVAYHVAAFGSAFGGYAELYQAPAHAWRGLDARSAFTLPLPEGLAGLLLSPGKGLVVYSPLLAAGLAALPIAAVRRAPLAVPLAAWVFGTLLVLAKNQLWWGGTAYGPRYLTELALPLVFGLGAVADRVGRRRALTALFAVLATYGVLVQALGAFTWDCGWHTSPSWLDYRPERLWDPADPEVLRCARALVRDGPRPFELGPFAP